MATRISFVFVAVFGWLGLNIAAPVAAQELNGSSAVSSQELLPASTKAWFSIPDSQRLDQKFLETQIGKLTQNEAFDPFIASLKKQFEAWMDEKNMQLGLDLENVEDVRSGEICIAGILPDPVPGAANQGLAAGSHGTVLLVDVSENIEAAEELLENLADKLQARGATREKFPAVHGAEASKWKFPKKSRLRDHTYAFHTISGGWLLSCDNEAIFRRIVLRLVNIDNVRRGETLAEQPAFKAVMDEVAVENIEPDVLWYINPFGYFALARAIAKEQQEFNQTDSDDWGRILRENGFDGFKGIGGIVSLATGKHEVLHRTFVYKPDALNDEKQKRVAGLFDFRNQDGKSLLPPEFVPESVASYFCGTWNMQRALKNVSYAVDTFTEEPGSCDKAINNLKVELGVDVRKVVDNFANEFAVVTDCKLPVTDDCERIAIVVRLNGNGGFVFDNIKKSWPQQHREFELGGHRIVEINDAIGEEEDDELDDLDDFGSFVDPGVGNDDEEEEEPEAPKFSVFQRRFCATTNDYLFIANNEEYLQQLLDKASERKLAEASDFQRVIESLEQIADPERICFRQFSRIDRVIRPNYEMIRTGKMVASDTILARALNHLFATKTKSDQQRKQKIDGSTLPSDFENEVAPAFGPAGWVMECTGEGWLFTGCLLARNDVSNQVVKKEDAADSLHK